jgi:glutamate/tyrosine decarboxylase-like PLP-dependent enzyme
MYWPKLNNHKIKLKVFEALSSNANYRTENVLGLPGTFLDTEIFYDDAPFLKDAPFLSSLIANPNHIGCHTLGPDHEDMFKGTQEIERDLIRICAEEIFRAEHGCYDGYMASGGTEANIEAIWIYRNYFREEFWGKPEEMLIICSSDTHYSINKAADLLGIDLLVIKVDEETRQMDLSDLEHKLNHEIKKGKKYFMPVLNLATTMFGSVDNIERVTDLLNLLQLNYKLHVDAAYGGFIYPFTNTESLFNFHNPYVSSISLDGHKMLQAPYGTGIFLIRKNFMKYVRTAEASYVKGTDYTLCGSRSGANAICTWMILHAHGSTGWTVKMNQLLDKTSNICYALDEMGIKYFRNPYLNIITIKSEFISQQLAKQYYLVPDTHASEPNWYKIVVMPHVRQGILDNFLMRLSSERLNHI